MTRRRAIVLLFIVVIGASATLLPGGRDELSWWWADSHNRSVDFKSYLETWPHGRHAADARLKYRQREWLENQKAMIQQAYEETSSPEADEEYRKQMRLRKDAFLWKAASSTDTPESYSSYLKQFPKGAHAQQAHARINAITHGSQTLLPTNTLPRELLPSKATRPQ